MNAFDWYQMHSRQSITIRMEFRPNVCDALESNFNIKGYCDNHRARQFVKQMFAMQRNNEFKFIAQFIPV